MIYLHSGTAQLEVRWVIRKVYRGIRNILNYLTTLSGRAAKRYLLKRAKLSRT